ncbi:MAG: FHA domain-containing protein [Solirubrobacteraceae bacterium]
MDPSIRLLLSVRVSELDTGVDVVVEVKDGTRIEDLSQAFFGYLGAPGRSSIIVGSEDAITLHCNRLGLLDPNEEVLEAGLRSGDELVLVAGPGFVEDAGGYAAKSVPKKNAVSLVVTAGPRAGLRVELSPGRYLFGRDRGCDIVLDDPSLSRRHLEIQVESETVNVRDLGSRNGSSLDGHPLLGDRQLTPDHGSQIEVGRSVITFSKQVVYPFEMGALEGGSMRFNRQPRIFESYQAPSFELEAPPPEASRVRLQVGAAILPLVLGGAFAVIFAQPALLLSMLLSPATLLWSYISERRHGRLLFQQNMTRYNKHLDELEGQLEAARAREGVVRRAAAPDASELSARVLEVRPELWERREGNDDFLTLRIGVADLPSEFTIDTHRMPISSRAQELLAAYHTTPMVPVTICLRQIESVGLVGPEARVDGLGLWLVLQLAILHSPRELSIVAAVDPDQREEWDWLKWLPHTRIDPSPIDGPRLVDDIQATEEMFLQISKVMSERYDGANGDSSSGSTPALVLFVDEDLVRERGTISEILKRGPAVGIYTIWLGHTRRGLPGECGSIALLDQDIARLAFVKVNGPEQFDDVAVDAVTAELALRVARSLASIDDTGSYVRSTTRYQEEGSSSDRARTMADDVPPFMVRITQLAWSHANADRSKSFVWDRPRADI